MAQSVQSLEPPWLNVPAEQAKHSVERVVALYSPAGQRMHVLLISYRPATQSVHAPEVPETAPEAHNGLCWADAAGAMMSATAATTHPSFPRGCFGADETIPEEDTMPVGGKQRVSLATPLRASGMERKCRDWRVRKG